jgi:hypothetical protein
MIAPELLSDYNVRPMTWTRFRARLRESWEPGEHMAAMGATGSGKTTLMVKGCLPIWRHVLFLDVKGGDSSAAKFDGKPLRGALPRINVFTQEYDYDSYRVIAPADTKAARALMLDALELVKRDGRWVVYIDEYRIMADKQFLGLEADMDWHYLFGRSRGITVIGGTQAPRKVSPAMWEQASHLFFIAGNRPPDRRAVYRAAEISGLDMDLLRDIVPQLDKHEFLYLGPSFSAVSRLELTT